MNDQDFGRMATGAACAVFDQSGRVLLVRHTYGRKNWELPGGVGESGESPDETARRELFEETGVRADIDRLTGVYFEPSHDFGPMLHFVFSVLWQDGLAPVPSSDEIADVGYWAIDDLPRPISDFTQRRISDAASPSLGTRVVRIERRRWLE
jgi:ADP-ribose pyrophosphatase YjhB (NUDIX family)